MSIDPSLLKLIILENQRDIPRIHLTRRGAVFDASVSYVLVGLRRVGKSYTLFEHIQSLLSEGKAQPEDILYVNFEDDRLYSFDVTDFERLLAAYHELFGADRRPLLFLDELQNITGWEKFARRLADTGHRVLLTGSNSRMLSTEIHTTLGARYLMREIHPFSFREFLRFKGMNVTPLTLFSPESRNIRRLFDDYLVWGGLAPVFSLSPQEKREWLKGLRDNILLRDIASRSGIRSVSGLTMLIRKLAESVMQPVSITRLLHLMKSANVDASRNSISAWLEAMQHACLIRNVPNFRDSIAERMTQQKHYLSDNGLLGCMLADPAAKLLENLTAIELFRRFDADQIFHYRHNVEVDFYLPEKRQAIQVSLTTANESTLKRETQALVQLAQALPVENCLVLTLDEERSLEEDGHTIHFVPLWKWLLDDGQA